MEEKNRKKYIAKFNNKEIQSIKYRLTKQQKKNKNDLNQNYCFKNYLLVDSPIELSDEELDEEE